MNLWEERDWDDCDGRWVERAECPVCGTDLSFLGGEFCSATCHDIASIANEYRGVNA